MHALDSLRTANLLMADVTRSTAATIAVRSGRQAPLSTLSGNLQDSASSGFGAPAQVSSFAFDSIFSVNYVDAHKLKINLMERVGKAFGFDLDDFADAGDMAREIDKLVAKMTHGEIMAIEKKLGLDELGVSLREVLDAMKDPGGDSDRKLDAALREKAGEILKGREQSAGTDSQSRFDEIGRYSF
ncbi:hypothetical protein SAZ10_09020 [Mesorhizobium sp. BAC0120]|uniref:hypothetical protein n=1 Tax=Mesorhizobium sp. BAC0120 TaxID=3090670 RepID=UPI00298C3CE1|nr:hypothetical protein [Mesorhizobium sp. BAC0120]MDW6021902.1 hypothetical protein [Mesorhizobium sp. BAC0120]